MELYSKFLSLQHNLESDQDEGRHQTQQPGQLYFLENFSWWGVPPLRVYTRQIRKLDNVCFLSIHESLAKPESYGVKVLLVTEKVVISLIIVQHNLQQYNDVVRCLHVKNSGFRFVHRDMKGPSICFFLPPNQTN